MDSLAVVQADLFQYSRMQRVDCKEVWPYIEIITPLAEIKNS